MIHQCFCLSCGKFPGGASFNNVLTYQFQAVYGRFSLVTSSLRTQTMSNRGAVKSQLNQAHTAWVTCALGSPYPILFRSFFTFLNALPKMTSGLGSLLFLLCSFWIVNVSLENDDGYNAAVTLLGGKFRMGSSSADIKRGELPTKTVGVKPFVIDKYPVTNENFRKFVRAKKLKTEAERFGWSFVFRTFVPEEVRSKITQSVPVG